MNNDIADIVYNLETLTQAANRVANATNKLTGVNTSLSNSQDTLKQILEAQQTLIGVTTVSTLLNIYIMRQEGKLSVKEGEMLLGACNLYNKISPENQIVTDKLLRGLFGNYFKKNTTNNQNTQEREM